MKKINITLLSLLALLFVACIDGDHDENYAGTPPYGNNALEETNVITIDSLKTRFRQYVTTAYTYRQITEDIKIKAYVTGNDIEGNIYNEVALQDETGAIMIGISQGGINGYLSEGTQVLVSLKDLYIGSYGLQATIGVPFTNNSGATYVSRMPAMLWASHYKIVGYNANAIQPKEYDASTIGNWDGYKNGGELATLKNVSIRSVSPITTWSDPNGTQPVSLYFQEISGTNTMTYTSAYADFAGVTVPQGKFNVTGIFKNYNGRCEIIIRKMSDVEEL